MRIDKNRLNAMAKPLPENVRNKMADRRMDRHWKSVSSAISAKILRHMKENGISKSGLAEILNITPANITRYLNCDTNFELKTLVEIERALGIEIINKSVVPVSASRTDEIRNMIVVSFVSSSVSEESLTLATGSKYIDYA